MAIDTVFPYDAVYTVDSGFVFQVLNGKVAGGPTAFEIDANTKTVTLFGPIKTASHVNLGNRTSSGDVVSFQSEGTELASIEADGRGVFDEASVLIPRFTDWADQQHPDASGVPDGTLWLSDWHNVRRLHVKVSTTVYQTNTF